MKTWFTVAEGAAYAGVSRDTIYTACERGELAGHQDLMTTQRYMHLSPAALDSAIRLLDASGMPQGLETCWRRDVSSQLNPFGRVI